MSVNYSLAYMSSEPGKPDGPKKYYAKMQASGVVTLDEIAEDISYSTTLTDGDVLNALRALIKQLNKHLAAGRIVRLENFGTFQLQLQSEGTDTEKEFTSSNITGASIQFRPGKPFKVATRTSDGGLEFKKVPKLKALAQLEETEEPETGSNSGNEGSFG